MTATITKEAAAWKLPDLDTVYHCEELGPMTLGQMLDGVDPDLVPSGQTMYEDLLWAFGAWDTLEQMDVRSFSFATIFSLFACSSLFCLRLYRQRCRPPVIRSVAFLFLAGS